MADEKDQVIHNLETEIARLRDENKKLEDTIAWMHDLIWQMVREREEQKLTKNQNEERPQENGTYNGSHVCENKNKSL